MSNGVDNSNFVNIVHKLLHDAREEHKKDLEKVNDRLTEGVSSFSKHQTEIGHLKDANIRIDGKIDNVIIEQGAMKAMLDDRVRQLEVKIATGKPNWFVVGIIMALISLIGGMWLFVIRGGS